MKKLKDLLLISAIAGLAGNLPKSAILGEGIWTMLYGALTSMGASKIKTVSPKTALSEAISHTLYGVAVASIAVAIADEGVFRRRI